MSQTVTRNSVLSQNLVECNSCTPWPSLRAHLAQAARTMRVRRHVVASSGPCSGPLPSRIVAEPGYVVSLASRVAGLAGRVAGCISTHPALRPCACRNPQHRIVAHRGRVAGPCPRSYRSLVAPPVTIQRIVSRHTSLTRPPACHNTKTVS